jgi:hypothetical protein
MGILKGRPEKEKATHRLHKMIPKNRFRKESEQCPETKRVWYISAQSTMDPKNTDFVVKNDDYVYGGIYRIQGLTG